MPNAKLGTVTFDVAKAVKEIKAGKIDFKAEKAGIVHAPMGKVSFGDVLHLQRGIFHPRHHSAPRSKARSLGRLNDWPESSTCARKRRATPRSTK